MIDRNSNDSNTNESAESDIKAIQLLKPREAAAALAVSERTLWQLTNDGKIPAVRLGRSVRYRIPDLETALQRLSTCNSTPGT